MSEQPKVRRKGVKLMLIIVTKRAVKNFHHNTRLFKAAVPLQELLCLSLTKEMEFFDLESGSDLTARSEGQEEEGQLQLRPAVPPLFQGTALPSLPSPSVLPSVTLCPLAITYFS